MCRNMEVDVVAYAWLEGERERKRVIVSVMSVKMCVAFLSFAFYSYRTLPRERMSRCALLTELNPREYTLYTVHIYV